MTRRNAKPVRVYEVLHDTGRDGGPAGDGTAIRRFHRSERAEAYAFAARSTCYGRPATVLEHDVPRHLAERWGVA